MSPHRLSPVACLLLFSACVTVKPVVVDRKTQLENQILGRGKALTSPRGEVRWKSEVKPCIERK